MNADNTRRRSELWKVVSVLLLGQFVSFILALLNFTSSLSANLGANSPVTLGLFRYLGLTLVNGSILLYQRHKLNIPWYWYWYALLAFFDVQGNFLFNSAYYFTSIQLFGAAICGVGLCLVLFSDSGVGGGGGSNPLLGDILVTGGTVFFALSNVGQEFCVKKYGPLEVITMLGLFGLLFSAIEIVIFETNSLQAVTWSPELILTFTGYTMAFFMFYSVTPLMLQRSGSMLFNLSLLTADMWAVVIRILFYHQMVDWLYYVSFSMVGVGLFIYSKTEKIPNPLPEYEDGTLNQQYRLVHDQVIESPYATR